TVATEGHQRLIGHGPLDLQHRRQWRRSRTQALRVGQLADRDRDTVALALAPVELAAEPVQPVLRTGYRDVVGEAAPPALADHVRALLHRAFAPGVPGRADIDADLVVHRHRAEADLEPA